jgi:hypothetical protein
MNNSNDRHDEHDEHGRRDGQLPANRNKADGVDISRNANGAAPELAAQYEREDAMNVEQDGAQDQELFAIIEDAISHRHGHHAEDGSQAHTSGAGGLVAAFSTQLATTVPRMDEHFHDELLARLIQELPETVEGQAAGLMSIEVSPITQPGTTPEHLPQRSPGRFPLPTTRRLRGLIGRFVTMGASGSNTQLPPERNRGWGASVATTVAGIAVLLLVVVGMAVTIKVRQDASQSSKDAQASLTQTTTAKGSSDTQNLVANLQSLSTLTATGTIAWSHSGSNLLTSGLSYGNMQTWDIANDTLLYSWKTGEGDIRAWAPDTRMLAIVNGRTVTLLDSTTGQELRSWNAPEQIVTLAWSPNSMKVATGPLDPNGVVRIWDATAGKELLSFTYATTPNSAYAPALAWSPDGKVLAVGDGLTAAQLWDTGSGKLVRSIGSDYQNRTRTILALTPSPTPLPTPAYRDVGGVGLPGLAWSPDERFIATSFARIVTIWDVASGQEVRTMGAPVPYDDHTSTWYSLGWVDSLSWSPDSKSLAVVNGTLTIWDVATGNLLRTLPGTEPVIGASQASRLATQATWSPDGRKLAVAFGFFDKTEVWGEGTDTIATPGPSPSSSPSVITNASPTSATPSTAPPDCASWQIVPSELADLYNQFTGVAATSSDDAWAVGFHSDKPVSGGLTDAYVGQDKVHILIEHWDGSNWNIIPSPDAGDSSYLFGVTAIDKTHAWAVGYTTTGNVQQTLILGWNGAKWEVLRSPNVSGMNNRLTSVTSLGSRDVWAAGSSGVYQDVNSGPSQTLILHFDGNAWSIVPSPSPSIFDNHLTAVSAAAADDVWAVGFQNPEQDRMGFLVLHWNGSVWTMVPQQTETKVAVIGLSGVAATAAGAWVTGGWTNIGGGSWQVGHYATDGRSDGTSPDLQTGEVADVYLSGVIAQSLGKSNVPGTSGTLDNVWAVGSIASNKGSKAAPPDLPPHDTLVIHWDGKVWSTPASPSVSGQDNQLSAIAAVPGSNEQAMLAVGFSSSDSASRPLILRYGACTTSEPTASGRTSTPVTPGTQTAPLPARTPGSPTSPASLPSPSLPLASVPDCGLTWSPVSVASSGGAGAPNQGPFTAVAAISADDVWTVGYGSTAPSDALTAHWDGASWSMVANPTATPGTRYASPTTMGKQPGSRMH